MLSKFLSRRSMELSKGEARKVNVVYFLSRNGKVEHPHLIRVHHFIRSGVRLRDVKRWLSELRGRELPDSFAWSFKRRYKSGYVWQDLLDDDLITPISDNEFVLKGCELLRPLYEKTPKEDLINDRERKQPETVEINADDEISPPELDDDSPSEYARRTAIFKIDVWKNKEKNMKKKEKEEEEEKRVATTTMTSRTLQVFRNILSCRAVDADEIVLMPIDRREVNRGGKGTKRAGEKGGVTVAVHKPVGAPNCSQCGKAFKPEKLHSHMKSCKALRSRGKSNTNLGSDGSKKNIVHN